MNDIVIGLDSSTTATKAIAVNIKGEILTQANISIPLHQPQANYYEQNAIDWWDSACKTLLKITGKIDPKKIKALAISNQRETFVALDKNGKILRPAIVWLDERSKSEVASFSQLIGPQKIHRITGKPVNYAPVVYRLAWMKKYEPDLFNQISMICDVHTWLVWKLTDTFKTSWASADPLGLFDLKNKQWSKEIYSALNINEKHLPLFCAPGTPIAKITEKAAKETGLDKDTLIVAGSGDGQAAGLGVNALNSQKAYLNLGTAVVAGIFSLDYRTHKAFRTLSACSNKGYYYECSLRAGTFAIDWFINNLLAIDTNKNSAIYETLKQEAQKIPPGSDGLFFLPYICGVMNPYWDLNARGAFIGLSSLHTRGHMYRAILEGIAFEQLLAISAVEQVTDININELIAIGGGAKSDLWCNIIAQITGKDISIPKYTEASALGVAIAAAVAIDWYPDFDQAAKSMTNIVKVIKPEQQLHMKYQHSYEVYKNLYHNLKAIGIKDISINL